MNLQHNPSISGFEEISKNLPSIIQKAQEVDLHFILSKICVSPPYFAFKKIYNYGDLMIATVVREQKLFNEVAKMSMGEMCRHAAILGTCSAAFGNLEKHYYLARKGVANSNYELNNSNNLNEDKFFIVMKCITSDKRYVNSVGVIIDSKYNIIGDVDVEYDKISDKIFRKFYNNHFRLTENKYYSPYSSIIELSEVNIGNDYLTGIFKNIPDEYCAGHFDSCPAIPIAFISYNVTRYAGILFSSITGIKKYHIKNATLQSSSLLFPEDRIDIKVKYDGKQNSDHLLLCTMSSGNNEASKLYLNFR